MRNVVCVSLLFSLLSGTVACKSAGSSQAGLRSASPTDGTENLKDANSLVFSRDLRMTDGALTEVTLRKGVSGTYDVSVHTKSIEDQELTIEIATGMKCKFVQTSISCVKDLRRVDGALKDVSIQKDDDGSYIIGARAQFLNRETGQTNDDGKSHVYSGMKLVVGA